MDVAETVSGVTTYNLSNRNHGFRGFHLSRLVNAGGGTTNAIYVTETMGNTVSYNGEVVSGATWYNVHIRVQSGNSLGFASHVINDASYVFIDFGNAANVNARLTEATAIDTMLGYLSNDDALDARLIHNTNVATTVMTQASYTGGTIMVSRVQPDTMVTEYEFTPLNGFSIDTTGGNTFITGVSPLPPVRMADGVLLVRNAGAPVSWQATFTRTYQVPQTQTTPAAPIGQYVYFNSGWHQMSSNTPVSLT